MFKFVPKVSPKTMQQVTQGPNRKSTQFPPNLAASLPKETQRQILLWLSSKYFWPQIQERVPFERQWDRMLEMSRIQLPIEAVTTGNDPLTRSTNLKTTEGTNKVKCADSTIHDAIERLTDITHFISFKDELPVQYNVPPYFSNAMENPAYRPTEALIKAGNCLLQWNSNNANVYRNHLIATRGHYTYGIQFLLSDYQFRVKPIVRQNNMGQMVQIPEITELGTTFEPMSIRKVFLNWRLPVYSMDLQPCPFFFEETPRFAILQNRYDPVTNPFGYANLDATFQQDYLYTGQEMQSIARGYSISKSVMDKFTQEKADSIASILRPEYSVEARWTAFPMMPLDPATGQFDFDGTKKIPLQRFVIEMFGPNIISGGQVFLRIQQNYYPEEKLPLYATCHMPDQDSGAYTPSIGQILNNHYTQICRAMEQFFDNKDWINNPPAWVQVSSPAVNQNLNIPGAKVKVNGPQDFGWRTPYDATASTVAVVKMLQEGAQNTSKAVDAIMGKAMGSRTSATEASNAFQASMSAITTDINLLNFDMMGGYAQRVWNYTAMWFDPDLLKEITGQFGFAILPEMMWINIGLKWDIGSTFIESVIKQQNLRYLLQIAPQLAGVANVPELLTQLLEEMDFDPAAIVNDGGVEQQVQFATLQACKTYLGEFVIVSPDQNHQIAIKVKTSFLEDTDSVWNQKYPQAKPLLIEQIKQHQLFLQLQQQMALAQAQMQVAHAQLGIAQREHERATPNPTQAELGPTPPGGAVQSSVGQAAQGGTGPQ